MTLGAGGMRPARHVAVLDVGKSNAKLVLFDLQEDREIAARTMPNEVRKDGLYPHFDVDRIFEFALDVSSRVHQARADRRDLHHHPRRISCPVEWRWPRAAGPGL